MPKRTAEIVLGGDKYTVRPFNIGELEQVAGIMSDGGLQDARGSFSVLKIALKRSDPSVTDEQFSQIEATLDEIAKAVDVLMELAGMKVEKVNPPQAPAAA